LRAGNEDNVGLRAGSQQQRRERGGMRNRNTYKKNGNTPRKIEKGKKPNNLINKVWQEEEKRDW
jgi:hypothetical protein